MICGSTFLLELSSSNVGTPGKSLFVFLSLSLSLRFSFSPFSPLFFFPIPLYYPPNPPSFVCSQLIFSFLLFLLFLSFSLFLHFLLSYPSFSIFSSFLIPFDFPSTELIKVRETSPHFPHIPHVISMFFPYFLYFLFLLYYIM